MPRRWVGDPALLPSVRALQKSAPEVKVKDFERWLRKQGITPLPAKGSHRKFEYQGHFAGYGTSGENDRLYLNDAKRLARFFGFPTVADFLLAIGRKALLSPAASAAQ